MFEYKILRLSEGIATLQLHEKEINALADDGWRLSKAVSPSTGSVLLYFERQREGTV